MTSTLLNHTTDGAPADIAAARAGDRDAFGRLYTTYWATVFRYVYFRTGRRVLAEDLAQETFMRALRRVDTFTWTGKDMGAWLVTIARNLVADYFKSMTYRRETLTDNSSAVAEFVMERGPDSADLVEESWTAQVLRRFLNMLGHEQRECLTLRFLNGLSVAETAAAMGKEEGAIKALQYRATRSVRRLMQEAGNPLGYPLP